ncbi:MAG: hypothetical protein LBQ46_09865, partial [Treponema sp.]|nr:hypothetical protein [Treponema sp.]
MKKTLLMIIVFAVMGMTAAAPLVQAQTQQQQQELEQIARRSMNGLSPQDRQRTIQIMTDVFVGQGMSRQRAVTLAEMSADSMFSSDVGEMSAEERRMFEEQNQAVGDYEQRQQQPPQQAQTLQLPGANTGWPSTAVLGKYTASLRNLN